MIKKLKAALCVIMALVILTGCAVVYVGDVATVNGEKVYHETFKYLSALTQMYFGAYPEDQGAYMLLQYDSVAQSYVQDGISDLINTIGTASEGESLWKKQIGDMTAKDIAVGYVLDKAIELEVMAQKAEEEGITLTDDEKASVSNFKNQLVSAIGSLTAYNKSLKSIGVTEKTVDALWEDILVAEKLRISHIATDDEVKGYYQDNYYNVKHILVRAGTNMTPDMESAKKLADELVVKLNEGADFDELMLNYSADRDAQGNLNSPDGYVFKEGDFGNPAFEEASMALEIDAYTKTPVEVNITGGTYQGYHIIKRFALTDEYFDNDTDGIKSAVKTAYMLENIENTQTRAYYEENFTGISYIFIEKAEDDTQDAALNEAKEVITKLSSGEDFDALLKTQSDDLRTEGGYAYEEKIGIDALDEAMNALEIGQFTEEPIFVDYGLNGKPGYYILKKTELTDMYYDSIKSGISSKILTQKYNEIIDGFMQDVKIKKNESKAKSDKFNEPIYYA